MDILHLNLATELGSFYHIFSLFFCLKPKGLYLSIWVRHKYINWKKMNQYIYQNDQSNHVNESISIMCVKHLLNRLIILNLALKVIKKESEHFLLNLSFMSWIPIKTFYPWWSILYSQLYSYPKLTYCQRTGLVKILVLFRECFLT